MALRLGAEPSSEDIEQCAGVQMDRWNFDTNFSRTVERRHVAVGPADQSPGHAEGAAEDQDHVPPHGALFELPDPQF